MSLKSTLVVWRCINTDGLAWLTATGSILLIPTPMMKDSLIQSNSVHPGLFPSIKQSVSLTVAQCYHVIYVTVASGNKAEKLCWCKSCLRSYPSRLSLHTFASFSCSLLEAPPSSSTQTARCSASALSSGVHGVQRALSLCLIQDSATWELEGTRGQSGRGQSGAVMEKCLHEKHKKPFGFWMCSTTSSASVVSHAFTSECWNVQQLWPELLDAEDAEVSGGCAKSEGLGGRWGDQWNPEGWR